MQALLGFTSERRWLRYAHAHLRDCSPTCPQQSGYNKRLRKLADTMAWLVGALGARPASSTDDVWVVDSTPVECGRPARPRTAPTWPAGPSTATAPPTAGYFWGLRLHLVCTLHGLPDRLGADRRQSRRTRRPARNPRLHTRSRRGRPAAMGDPDRRQELLRQAFEADLAAAGIDLLRPTRKGEHTQTRRTVLQTTAPDHRVGQRHPQRPTRPRSTTAAAPSPASAPASPNASSP